MQRACFQGSTLSPLILAALLAGALTACNQRPTSSPPPLEDRPAAQVAATPAFTFYSHFWVNLHDYLYQQAQQEDNTAPNTACLEDLTQQHRDQWLAAARFYEDQMGHRHHRVDDLMWTVRLKLAGIPHDDARHDSLTIVTDHLQQAAPAYHACWWADHDRRNRAWIDTLMGHLTVYEDTIKARLSRYYGDPWPAEAMPVDVVSYASWGGANTITAPNHMMMSSVNEGYKGWAALEMTFHEASHTIVGGRMGTIAQYVREASRTHGEDPPGGLWHVILFYTTGETVQQLLAESGIAPYTMYMYERGLFNGRWAPYQQPIEQHWQRYLDHEVDLRTGVYALIDAIYEP